MVVISRPVLVLVVGSAGLASNLVGLVLFHDHGHGGHEHDVEGGHGNEIHHHEEEEAFIPESSSVPGSSESIEDILPETIVRRASSLSRGSRSSYDHNPATSPTKRAKRRSFATADDIKVSPAANRQYILDQIKTGLAEETDSDTPTPLRPRSSSIPHDTHHHSKPAKVGGLGHGNLNMRGVFLHVLGDALGNIGVIITALFIWWTDYEWRFYADPVVSLVITMIIFSSALPLVKSASLILLQGVPRGISLDDVKEDLLQVPLER